MNKIEKLLRKIGKKDRQKLLGVIEKLMNGKTEALKIQKIKDTDFYRLKSGRLRIIFHYYQKEIVIDSIRLRSEKTYKKL